MRPKHNVFLDGAINTDVGANDGQFTQLSMDAVGEFKVQTSNFGAEYPTILKNPGVVGRHWVSFELAGTKSNRLAIGARVMITAGGMTQTEEIHSGGSYLSQSDLRVHFGLGSATKIDSVEIRWPSGATNTLKNLGADSFYSVLEGRALFPRNRSGHL